jgi:hypothetical protein
MDFLTYPEKFNFSKYLVKGKILKQYNVLHSMLRFKLCHRLKVPGEPLLHHSSVQRINEQERHLQATEGV